MTQGENGAGENSTIEKSIEAASWFHKDDDGDWGDRVFTANFNDDGQAEAVVGFASCISESQMADLIADETWEIAHVHPNGNDVRAHLRERL